MKTFKLIVVAVFIATISTAQTPQAIKYQAVIRDLNGNIFANKNVTLQIGIVQDSDDGSVVYSELFESISNSFGLIDIEIGNGNSPTSDFSKINWADGKYFIKVELDIGGGNNFQLMGISPLLSVPYALLAQNAVNEFSGEYKDLKNQPILFDGEWTSINGKPDFAQVAESGNYNDLKNKPVTDGSETKVTEGVNIKVSGSGTASNPYKIDAVNNHYPGELFGGGVVFYLDHTGQHGLICSLVDLADFNCAWSNITVEAIGDNARNTWDGQGNTKAIINQPGHTSSAAKLCDDYTNADYGTGIFSDWFLPSIDQLSKLCSARYEVNKTLYTDENSITDPLLKISYWSSNEGSSQYAFHYDFQTVSSNPIGKYQNNCVRAIRSF
jgi:hypothetical protein